MSPALSSVRLLAAALCLVGAVFFVGCGEETEPEPASTPGVTGPQISASDVGDRFLRDPREPRREVERPNVLVIAVDNVRADRMSSWGGPRETTPNLDALAARGTRFSHVISQAPYTPHSFSSLFTSLYVADLPVRTRGRTRGRDPIDRAGLEPYHVTLAEAFRDAGYATGAVLQGWFTDAFGLTQGYEWTTYERRTMTETNEQTIRWLEAWKERGSDRPFFHVSYSLDPHYRFMAGRSRDQHVFGGNPRGYNYNRERLQEARNGDRVPTEADLDNALTLYDEGLYWMDRDTQALLDALDEMGIADNTVIVFVSDHGEEFDEHGYLSHGQSNFRSVIHVPLIIFDPRLPARHRGRVVDTPIMNIDIMPTILDLANIPTPETAKGVSLVPSIRGLEQPELDNRYLFTEGAWNGFVGAVTVGNYTFLLDERNRRYLYDWQADPGEQDNLVNAKPRLAKHLQEILFLHKRNGLATQLLLALGGTVEIDGIGQPIGQNLQWTPPAGDGEGAPTLSEDSEEQLRALGYL